MTPTEVDLWFQREVLPLDDALARFLRRHWGDSSEVADFRQEVYIRIYEAACASIPMNTRAFVFATARHLLIDKVRHQRVVPMVMSNELVAEAISGDETPERAASSRQQLRQLQAAIDELPPRCREVVVLRKIEELSQREVAARLGIAEGTVEKQVAKGIRMLADVFLKLSTTHATEKLWSRGRK
jgi:RNA polymerase sigma-70 factor (ECF subfamily)